MYAHHTRRTASTWLGLAVLLVVAAALLSGCNSGSIISEDTDPNTTPGTVQAQLPGTTATVDASGSVSGTATAGSNPWPARAVSYAKATKSTVWFPTSVVKGYAIEEANVTELNEGSKVYSLDMTWLSSDEKAITLQQGTVDELASGMSEATGKVQWGDQTANYYADEGLIIWFERGKCAVLSASENITPDQLKVIAASMVKVTY